MRSVSPLDDAALVAMRGAITTGIALDPFRREQALVGVDLSIALDQPVGARALVENALQLASEHGLTLFDPQLGRSVGEGDLSEIEERFTQTATFNETGFLGTSNDPRYRATRQANARMWLWVGGLIVVVLLLGRLLRCAAS